MRKKLEHWWTYHKGIVIFAVVLAAAVLYVAGTMGKKRKDTDSHGRSGQQCAGRCGDNPDGGGDPRGIGGDPNGEEVVVDTALTMDAAALGADADRRCQYAGFPRNDHDVRVCARFDFMILEKMCLTITVT